MNFRFFIISIILTSGFVGVTFAETVSGEKEFSKGEILEMKHKAVLISMDDGTFMLELFPEDAPNTVHNFLKLVESGYYDGMVFHRIIPGFMIQVGDPNTKDPEADRSSWGQGGPGYSINAEFNTLQHDRGVVSMARSQHPDSAGSQFFIVQKDSNFLDGQYTAFGKLVPGTYSNQLLDTIASLETDARDAPLDVSRATITKATILDDFTAAGFAGPDRNESIVTETKTAGGSTDQYVNTLHKVSFDLPYRWAVIEGTGNYLNLVLEPGPLEHNVQLQIDETGFTPQVLVISEERDPSTESAGVSIKRFLIQGGERPKVLSDYVYENDDGRKAHLLIATQDYITEKETIQFKIMQLTFLNSEFNYSVIYFNLTEWFRYEVNAFVQTVNNFEIMIDGKMQPINFSSDPVFKQLIIDAREIPEADSIPPKGGGCLIATASYGSELAPQIQQLRELRDNTILQTESGSAFMAGFNQFYYSFSPMIADYERENQVFKEAVKLTLTPLLTSLTLLQYVDIDSEHEMLGYGIAIILLNIGMYFIAPAILITKIRSLYKLQ